MYLTTSEGVMLTVLAAGEKHCRELRAAMAEELSRSGFYVVLNRLCDRGFVEYCRPQATSGRAFRITGEGAAALGLLRVRLAIS